MAAARDTFIGVSDFRNNLSAHLKRVQMGEILTITDHGRPVAELKAARPDPQTIWEQWIAEGKMSAPRGDGKNKPPIRGEMSTIASEILQEMRREDRERF